jgi:hypothetical protein
MRRQMQPVIPLAIVISAAAAAVAVRAAGRRSAVTAGRPDLVRPGMAALPRTLGGGPDRSFEQMQYVFHELHADGRHAVCTVCDSRY